MIASGLIDKEARRTERHSVDTREEELFLPLMADALLLIPAIVDLSMGMTEFFPAKVMIYESGFQLDRPCLDNTPNGCWRGMNETRCEAH